MIRLVWKQRLPIVFAATLALLLLSGVLSWRNINRLIDNNERVDNSYKVLVQLAEIRSALGEAESGQRGYLLTGRAHYLEHHQEALTLLHKSQERLQRFTADNPQQQERLRQLGPAIENYRKLCEPITRLQPNDPGFKTDTLARCESGQDLIDEIGQVLLPVSDEEMDLLRKRLRQSQFGGAATVVTLIVVSLLAAALLVVLAVVMWRELGQRTRAEEALRQSEEMFRGDFERSGVAKTQVHPATGQFLRVNRKFRQLTGYSEEELQCRTFLDITHAEDRDGSSLAYHRMVRGETADYASTKRYLRKDGAVIWIHVNATLITDVAGQPAHVVAVVQDVTEEKRAQEAVRESEARFRLLADALPQMVWTTDADGNLDYCNKRWNEYTGLNLEQSLAGNAAIHPDDREELGRTWQQALTTGGMFETEVRVRRRSDGAYRWHLSRGLPVRYANGPGSDIVRWFGTTTDIEDQKRAEQATLQANEELERRVAERTDKLHQATLMAEAASRTKSEFLASISHEIRTPMNGILGMTEMALDTALSEQQREYLSVVKVSAQSLLSLLNDILDFSKMEAGKLELHLSPFSLRQEVEEALKPLALRAAGKGLRWQCAIAADTPDLLLGDAIRLRQVLLNLASNAVKFTHEGEVFVSVGQAASLPSEGDRLAACPTEVGLHFDVRDTGIGIPADKLRAIFDPFVQADGSLSKKYGGTGLGLSIASRLVEIMGGRIDVQSEVGQGSTFSFTIAMPRSMQPPAFNALPESQPDAATSVNGKHAAEPLRILLVEDNLFNQQVGVYLLQRQGHAVDVVGSGADALALLAKRSYDLVLMDVQMPEMDGLETTTAIRRQEAHTGRRTPIVALTAYASPSDRRRCLQAGMDGHLTKPLDPMQLEEVVRQARSGGLGNGAVADQPVVESSPDAVFDPAGTLERLSGNRQLLCDVSKMFAENSARLLGQMRVSLAGKDFPALRRAAHTLRGSMSFFASPAAVKAAERLEDSGDNAPAAEAALQALTRAVDRLRAALARVAGSQDQVVRH